MTPFEQMCRQSAYHGERIERTGPTLSDAAQDAWVQYFLHAHRANKTLPEARTADELQEAYQRDAGMLVTQRRRELIREHKEQKALSLDALIDQALDDSFDVVDECAEDQYTAVLNEIDAKQAFALFLNGLPAYKQEAVRRFIALYSRVEHGGTISNAEAQRLRRDREATGFAFVLPRGAPVKPRAT